MEALCTGAFARKALQGLSDASSWRKGFVMRAILWALIAKSFTVLWDDEWLGEVTHLMSAMCIGHVLGGRRPLVREGGPISYEATPSAFFKPDPPPPPPPLGWPKTHLMSAMRMEQRTFSPVHRVLL